MGRLYDENSIESLSPLEFTRLRSELYAGDTNYSTQLVIEIVSNAVDEFRAGHGNMIEVVVNGDKVRITDNGQGFIPNLIREDGKTVLEAAFSVLNTSGKYHDDGTYEGTSLGSFGIGCKISTFLSNWLDVTTHRDGLYETVHFVEGVFNDRQVGESKHAPGTVVEWKASPEFFKHTEPDVAKLATLFNTISCLCPGLSIVFNNNGEIEEFYSQNGISDLVEQAVGDKEILNKRFHVKYSEDKLGMDFVLTYTTDYTPTIIPYVNAGLTERGPHITQIKTTLTREFNKFFKDKKWLKEKEANLTGDDIQEGMYVVFNLTAPNVSYNAQVKNTVVDIDMKEFTSVLSSELQVWLEENEKQVKEIAVKAINARKAREAAKKARDNVRKKQKDKVIKSAKLCDANSKDRSKCEIYITEGDSATGGIQMARNAEFQAVLPVRGKILNCAKSTIAQIQKNAEIMTMIDAFGLDIDLETMSVTYDEQNLRYDKIIIMSDADIDGSHIKNLFYTFVWSFCPQLILDGHVYAGVPPLYKITLGGNKGYKYLKDDAALDEFRKANGGKKYEIGRMKG